MAAIYRWLAIQTTEFMDKLTTAALDAAWSEMPEEKIQEVLMFHTAFTLCANDEGKARPNDIVACLLEHEEIMDQMLEDVFAPMAEMARNYYLAEQRVN